MSKSSDELRQALKIGGSEQKKEKKKGNLRYGYGIDVWGMLLLVTCRNYFLVYLKKFDVSNFKCDVCELAKSHRALFPSTLTKSPVPFMIIHSDIWGPSKFATLDGLRWFSNFIDDCTKMTWVCLMKSKSEVSLLFQNFHKMVCSQYNAQVQVLRSDNGGEYMSFELKRYLEAHGTIHQTTCSNTPQ